METIKVGPAERAEGHRTDGDRRRRTRGSGGLPRVDAERSRNSNTQAAGPDVQGSGSSNRDADAEDRVVVLKARVRKTGKRLGIVLVSIFVIGTVSNMAQSFSTSTQPHPQLTVPPPRIITHTVTVTKTVQARLPQVCRDYVAELDTAVQSVYNYQRAVEHESDTLDLGLQAMIDADPNELNRVRSAQSQLDSDMADPLQQIVSSKDLLKRLAASCNTAIGGR